MKTLSIAVLLLAATSGVCGATTSCPRIANDIMETAAVTLGNEAYNSLVQACEAGRKAKRIGMSFDVFYREVVLPSNTEMAGNSVPGAYGATLSQVALLEGFAQ